jgi:hypothetical protein
VYAIYEGPDVRVERLYVSRKQKKRAIQGPCIFQHYLHEFVLCPCSADAGGRGQLSIVKEEATRYMMIRIGRDLQSPDGRSRLPIVMHALICALITLSLALCRNYARLLRSHRS